MCQTCGHIEPLSSPPFYGEGLGVGLFVNSNLKPYIRQIFDRILKPGQVSKENVKSTFDTLYNGVEKGYGKSIANIDYNSPDYKALAFMRANVFQFSAYKDYHNVLLVNTLLIDSEGKKRSFADFKTEAMKIDETFNGRYLETEYNLAQLSGRAASQWQEFERNADLFPLLKYSTAGDANVRPEHQLLDGVIKPISDPFWNIYFPPNDWGCRCNVEQVTDEQAKPTPNEKIETPEMKPIFKNNVGKTGTIFPASHPYFEVLKPHQEAANNLFGLTLSDVLKNAQNLEKKVDLQPNMEKEEARKYKKEIEKQVKSKIQGKQFKIDGFNRKFIVYGSGIDKAVQQKHKHEKEKIEALLNFEEFIKNAKYIGSQNESKDRKDILQHHYFEVLINGEKSYINVREMVQSNELQFWTIKDSNSLNKE